MTTKKKSAESDLLRLYDIALTNGESNPEINTIMAGLGYDSESLVVGKELLKKTQAVYKVSKAEKEKLAAASVDLKSKRIALNLNYEEDRLKARVVFKRDKLTSDKLAISGKLLRTYGPWIDKATKFYEELAANPDILQKLSRLGIKEENIHLGLEKVAEVVAARAVYTNLKGESQKSTKLKEAAFVPLKEWMSDFYAVAKIAFKDQPQQVESLGKIVKG
jgi:hypothetical protein